MIGWGYYYLVTVLDDLSRFISAHKLQRDMTSDSFIEVVQDAVDKTGMTEVPVEERTRLLSDNGSGYVSRAFGVYLRLVGIRHILAAPFHPQTNGKLERYHQTIKQDVNQVPYEVPSDLEAVIVAFVSYYSYRHYHKALGNVTPSDVLGGRREDILRRSREVQTQTIERRRRYNMALRELPTPQNNPGSLASQSVPILLAANTNGQQACGPGEWKGGVPVRGCGLLHPQEGGGLGATAYQSPWSVHLYSSYLEGHPLLDSVQEARCQGCCGPSVYFHHIPAGNYVSGGEVFEDYAGKRPHV